MNKKKEAFALINMLNLVLQTVRQERMLYSSFTNIFVLFLYSRPGYSTYNILYMSVCAYVMLVLIFYRQCRWLSVLHLNVTSISFSSKPVPLFLYLPFPFFLTLMLSFYFKQFCYHWTQSFYLKCLYLLLLRSWWLHQGFWI